MSDKLVEALEPFAKAADVRLCGGEDYWTDDKSIQGTDVAFHVTFGDLRRARRVLSSRPDAGDAEACATCGKGEHYVGHQPYNADHHEFAHPPAADAVGTDAGEGEAICYISDAALERMKGDPSLRLQIMAGAKNDMLVHPLYVRAADALGTGDILEAYRAAVRWIAADSWDGCSECIRILQMARSLDDMDWSPDQHAAALKRLYGRAGQSPLSTPPRQPDGEAVREALEQIVKKPWRGTTVAELQRIAQKALASTKSPDADGGAK